MDIFNKWFKKPTTPPATEWQLKNYKWLTTERQAEIHVEWVEWNHKFQIDKLEARIFKHNWWRKAAIKDPGTSQKRVDQLTEWINADAVELIKLKRS